MEETVPKPAPPPPLLRLYAIDEQRAVSSAAFRIDENVCVEISPCLVVNAITRQRENCKSGIKTNELKMMLLTKGPPHFCRLSGGAANPSQWRLQVLQKIPEINNFERAARMTMT